MGRTFARAAVILSLGVTFFACSQEGPGTTEDVGIDADVATDVVDVDANNDPDSDTGEVGGTVCGDDRIDAPYEQCEPNTPVACADADFAFGTATCSDTCRIDTSACSGAPICGDGSVDGEEACDDGNTIDGDGCSAECILDQCGDGDTTGDEACDGDRTMICADGSLGVLPCSDDCTLQGSTCLPEGICGDGELNAGEACDDGNTIDGDGCDANCVPTACGNGMLEGVELCDGDVFDGQDCTSLGFSSGNLYCSDTCRLDTERCEIAVCGDGLTNVVEACDDGNRVSGDGCSRDCVVEYCGDGRVSAGSGEQCDGVNVAGLTCADFGYALAPLQCTSTCALDLSDCESLPLCGDGVLDADLGEECDDGNATNGDGCTAGCLAESCGDRIVQSNEVCEPELAPDETCIDRGYVDGVLRCNAACELDESACLSTTCGNGVLDDDEACDGRLSRSACLDEGFDFGAVDCTDECELVTDRCFNMASCGDGRRGGSEECDDGNLVDGDGCSLDCVLEYCGDGIVQPVLDEVCDGSTLVARGCGDDFQQVGTVQCEPDVCIYAALQCVVVTCGNGILERGEACDDGNLDINDGCDSTCRSETCDDAILQPYEACEGETDATCADIDVNIGEPRCVNCVVDYSFCGPDPVCGNGFIERGEACDDGNGDDDACNSFCRVPVRCLENQYVQEGVCTDCAPGSTKPPGDDAAGANTTCDPTRCFVDEYVASNVCTTCAPGTTNDAGDDASGVDTSCAPTLCAVNEYVQDNICTTCAPGTTNVEDNDASGVDTTCPPTLCAANEYVASNVCTTCAPGTTNAADDDASAADTTCEPTLCAVDEFVLGNACTPCAPGTTNAANDDASAADTTCAPTLCGVDQYVASNACAACAPGTTNAANDDASAADTSCEPTLCSVDQYVASNACAACAPGTTNAANDDASAADTTCEPTLCAADEFVLGNACTPCAPGTTNAANDDASAADTSCAPTLCGVDQYVAGNACAACAPGTTNAANDDASGVDTACEATLCATNRRVRMNACVGCAAGTTNEAGDDASGVNTFCDATLCEVDEYVLNNRCTTCAPGTTNAANDVASGSDTTCDPTLCAVDQYVASNTCTACAPGTTNAANDDASSLDTMCDPTLCAVNQYVASNTCTGCAPGTTNPANDDASGGDTSCTATICVVDQYVASNACTACAPGTTNSAGNDASGGDTACTAVICALDQYVASNTCTACAPGTTNSAGNDASGGDTSCTAIICGEDEYVSGHICTPCGVGTYNDPGDDAEQADTVCDQDACSLAFGVRCDDFNQAYVKASTIGAEELFGYSVALSDDGATLAVGALQEDSNATGVGGDQTNNSALNSGAVFVFVRDIAGAWTQQAYLKASNTNFDDYFGASLAISADGSTLAVGAINEASNTTGVNGLQSDNSLGASGAVYVFVRDGGGVWTQQAYVKASNTDANDSFGQSVTLSDDGATLAVGAINEDSAATGVDGDQTDILSETDSGAVYVYTRDGGGAWTQQAYIKASNTGANDNFGQSVTLSGDGATLVVGAPGEASIATGVDGDDSTNSAPDAGAVYVFTRELSVWTQQAYIKASNTNQADSFGYSVVLSEDGDTLAVGAFGEQSMATGIDGDEDDNSLTFAPGAAYVFTRDGSDVWTQQAYLKASNTDEGDWFGFRIALSNDGDTLAVGAVMEDSAATGVDGNQSDDAALESGAVYVFRRNGAVWTHQAYVKASNTDAGDQFGYSIALSGDGTTLAVGAITESGNSTGVNGNQGDNSLTEPGAVYVRLINDGTP